MFDVIICTRNRYSELVSTIETLTKVESSDKIDLLIVENSSNFEDKLHVKQYIESLNIFKSARVIDSEPGLPRSRNLGLVSSRNELITFLDDDVEVDRFYFSNLEKLAEENSEVAGFGSIIFTDGKSHSMQNGIPRLLMNHHYFSIFYPCRSIWWNDTSRTIQTRWIPGCAMSFKRSKLGNLKFNESLENGPTKGYALGEDFDFTYKLSKTSILIQSPKLLIRHKLSLVNRNSLHVMDEALGRWIAYQDRNFFKYLPVPISFFLLLLSDLRSFSSRKIHPKLIFGRTKGFIHELKNPVLIQN